MIIELQRAFTPEEYGHEEECAVCRLPFRTEVVLAQTVTDYRMEMGYTCPACVEYLGTRGSKHFPTVEEYRELVKRYPQPIWPTKDAAERAEHDGSFGAAFEASWVWRAPASL